MTESNSKRRVLSMADSICSTGFAKVSQAIYKALAKTGNYEIDTISINHTGAPYDRDEWPINAYPACMALNQRYNDVYGRQQFVDRIVNNDYDLIFIIQDTFIVETFIDQIREAISKKVKQPPIIFYYPIDAPPKDSWVETVSKCNFPVAYTQWAKDECLKWRPELDHKIKVIHHGVNPTQFYPLEEDMTEFRKMWFSGHADGKFLMMNVNRNQSRKDIVRTFMILDELKRRGRDNIHLYMHMAQVDAGGDLNEMAKNFGLAFGDDWTCPANFDPHSGVLIDSLNRLYNAADLLISTHRGEGFGFSPMESASTKTPMVLPDNTVMGELWGDNKAFLVPSGDNVSMWEMKEMDNERLRPIMDVEKAADAVERVMDGDLPDVEAAYQFAVDHSWDNICKEWIALFDAAQPNIVPFANNEEIAQLATGPGMNRAERRRRERETRKKAKHVEPAR